MKKGCVVAIIVALVIIIAGAIGIGVAMKKMGGLGGVMEFANAGIVYSVEQGAMIYMAQNPDAQVEPTNEAWAETLQGATVQGNNLNQFIQNGKFIDAHQNPIKIEANPDGGIKAISAGADGQFGTEDDVTSAKIEELEKKFGGGAE